MTHTIRLDDWQMGILLGAMTVSADVARTRRMDGIADARDEVRKAIEEQINNPPRKVIVYPSDGIPGGFYVLANCPHPAVTVDAAWRPAAEIENAKEFADETAAKAYISRWFPMIPLAGFVIRDAVVTQTREDDPRFRVVCIKGHAN